MVLLRVLRERIGEGEGDGRVLGAHTHIAEERHARINHKGLIDLEFGLPNMVTRIPTRVLATFTVINIGGIEVRSRFRSFEELDAVRSRVVHADDLDLANREAGGNRVRDERITLGRRNRAARLDLAGENEGDGRIFRAHTHIAEKRRASGDILFVNLILRFPNMVTRIPPRVLAALAVVNVGGIQDRSRLRSFEELDAVRTRIVHADHLDVLELDGIAIRADTFENCTERSVALRHRDVVVADCVTDGKIIQLVVIGDGQKEVKGK